MYKIMVIEDDKKLQELIKNHLEKYGYETCIVEDFSQIKKEFINHSPHLVLMDINLPYYDGFYWCRDIRTVSKVPIIFISARGSDMDQVMAIENGGDDYITKPFSYDLLIVKIKGVIRRVYGEYSENNHNEVYEVDGLYMHVHQNIIEYSGRKTELSSKEFLLLYSLLKSVNQIVSREELLEILWNDIDFVDDNTLSVNITRLRKRLEEIGIDDAIETKRGQGYKMVSNWSR
ncbi:DNA-binding response regulator, OmpR family, contains REC and winged-helix (wHTH) domain [Proteiniborus ethanoligenes]|uniref:Stage 0 sporulation protein A homolog n=1 Tax=Proteiniborus ethanoligenes TaxID=415015 RepID=A0A1H3KL66_9FIRM|nr:response regulator transcription factor [Proteiniborus ethanoligenes]TAH63652.1 MAG: response regulator transcription factor [Gottschalkiaceae bacterium]SDY52816.1 DNA-binding response regulator, OmpR family, contains REC and winged-helix (wHTH) domain [Proteiniborus ethanoligenes]